MVHFHHEEPQGVRHSADLSASPMDANWIEGRQYTKYEPILVIEGKRLPTPGSGREREYVSSPAGEKPAGGIQRFKLGLHGGTLSRAGMIGYVQEKTCEVWFEKVNYWIDQLASGDDPLWSSTDRLRGFRFESPDRVSRCESEHPRTQGLSPTIRLTHLWVEMNRG
jgi:hypothetical protein